MSTEYTLEELFDLQMGKTPSRNNPEYWNSADYKWISIGDLSKCGKFISETKEYLSDTAVSESGISQIPADTVVMSFKLSIGKTAITAEPMYSNEAIMSFRDRHVVDLLPDYIYYMFSGRNWDTGTNKAVMGKTLNKATLSKIKIRVHPIEEQKHIIGVLDKVATVIDARNKELQTLDDLIKARFVEMFGDPEKNEFGWEKVSINTVVRGKASNGYFAKREEYVDDGNVAVLGVAYVVNRMYSQVEGLPRTNATSTDIQKHQVKYGDMLFCRSSLVAEGIGKASIVPENTPENTLFECHVIRLPLDLKKCVPEFIQVLSTTDYFRKQIISQSKTATMTTIGQDGILKSTIILPPLEKQREFYAFVKQVDKSKVVVQKALDEAQLLFDSLMQQYFG
ncbi:MAG: restriction endonuclease subunit S [Clostridia bacterium]|nr:restriction endonuclease subunit S [Clostridia bacterium]